MPMKKLRILKTILLTILLASCQEDTYYHSYQSVNGMGWNRNDTLTYILPNPITIDTSIPLEIGIRHKDSYHYRDLWLTINGDTCHLFLADTIGKWFGNGIGEVRQLTNSISFQVKDDSINKLEILHIMQDNPLQGILDIGVRIAPE